MHSKVTRQGEGTSEETVEIVEKCRKARLDGRSDSYGRSYRRKAARAMRRDLEWKIKGLCEVVEGKLTTGNSRLAVPVQTEPYFWKSLQ